MRVCCAGTAPGDHGGGKALIVVAGGGRLENKTVVDGAGWWGGPDLKVVAREWLWAGLVHGGDAGGKNRVAAQRWVLGIGGESGVRSAAGGCWLTGE